MKNVSKKLFSLVLAAVLLLSVVPFQALAAEGGFQVELYIDNGITGERKFTKVIDEKAGSEYTVQNYLDTYLSEAGVSADDCSGFYYDVLNQYNEFESVNADKKITEATTLVIRFMPKDDAATQPEQKPEQPPVTESEMCKVHIEIVDWKGNYYTEFELNVKKGDTLDLNTHVDNYSGFAKDLDTGDKLADRFVVTRDMKIKAGNNVNKPEDSKPEEKPEEQKVGLFVQVVDRDTKKEITSYGYNVKDGQAWDLKDTQKSLEAKGYGIAYYTVNGVEMDKLDFTIKGETNVIVYAVKTDDSKPDADDSEDDKPIDPKEKTEVIIKVYEYKGNEKVDTIYYTGKRGSYVDLDQIVNKYVIRQYRYEGKSTNSRIKLQGEEMTIVAIMDEDQGDMCTVTLRVHFKNAIQKEIYKFKSGTEIDIGKILVEDDVLDSVKEIEKIYLRGVHVNKNNNIVTVKRSGTYDVYTDEKPYDSEDHSYPSYDKDEDLDKNAGKATLKFYLKKDMQKYTKPSAVKTITISNTAALDSKVTLQEVKKLAANYFKAENSEGIDFGDGLYIQEEYDNAKDVWDSTDGVDVFYNVNAMRNDGDVTFFVVLDNVKSVSSGSNADSSNPKTGDSIFVAVTVMAVSSLALGAAYVLNKKRMAR